jgi:DNA (cytosine-5)-methyltransferase 1
MESESPAMTEPRRTYKVLSLFSGAMGLDIGLEETGRFETVAAVEKVPAFCATMRKNRDAGRTARKVMEVIEGDISSMDPHDILRQIGLEAADIDLVVGGPPCQSFSTAGRRGTTQDPRGTLLWQFLRFVHEIRPPYFLMENVRGLMSAALNHRPIAERPDKGGAAYLPDELPGSVVRRFVADLEGDYRMDVFEVNSANYGAPQIRERVLFIGNRLGKVVDFPGPTHGAEVDDRNQLFAALQPFKTLGEALEGLIDPDPVRMEFSERKLSYLAQVPPGGNWRALPEDVARESMGRAFHAKGGRSGWWRRLSLDLPSPTIVTMPNHASTALCHPTETRALTLRECARVQEFPDEWEFTGSPQEQFAQVGNAVPVRLGIVAGEVLARELDSADRTCGPSSDLPPVRHVHLSSHVRTRQWFKAGETFVRDAADPDASSYSAQRRASSGRIDPA